MDKITVGFALECAKDGALWDKYFKGKTLLDVLLTAKGCDVEFLIRAGISPKDAVEIMAERQQGHIGCSGRKLVYVNAKRRSSASLVEKPAAKRVKVIIRKKSGAVYGRQVINTKDGSKKVIAWNQFSK